MAVHYYVASSLDGFIADAHDSVDWLDALPQPDKPSYERFIEGIGAIVMGASSYAFILRHIEGGGTWPYTQPTWVFTHQEFEPREGVTFIQGSVQAHHEDILAAAGGKDIWVVGGGDLAGQYHDAGLLDALIVNVASTTLGTGKPLLPRTVKLRLLEAESMGEGFVELRYDVLS